jgi:hypothetical protein
MLKRFLNRGKYVRTPGRSINSNLTKNMGDLMQNNTLRLKMIREKKN